VSALTVGLLWRDLKSSKLSVGTPHSLPEWLRSVVSNRASGLIDEVVSSLGAAFDGGSVN
jgi:hypothetical protein